ncbi:MAG: pyridoxamine 5'-phosphate oxidase family protein [Butyricicoccus sp.]|nr:pyridoxamine 5'-phosphate oxidase family protein [Butyricicoccus sp.]
MSRSYEFLKECGVFFVLTMNGDHPAGRPFGAIMEHEGTLYFSTATMKDVYKQLIHNPKIQILALKHGTRDWIRINGFAVECHDIAIKQKMLEECPVLTKHFDSAVCAYYAVFEVSDKEALLNLNNEFLYVD